MPAFTPQPQSITALWLALILPSHGGYKAESTWVVGYIPNPDTVTHPSTNRAQRSLASLI